jgi:hypothetical protein
MNLFLHNMCKNTNDSICQSRLQPQNIWILVQTKHAGYNYNVSHQRFVASAESVKRSPGSGVAMMQLNWPGEACKLQQDGSMTRMMDTALENLEKLGIT